MTMVIGWAGKIERIIIIGTTTTIIIVVIVIIIIIIIMCGNVMRSQNINYNILTQFILLFVENDLI